MDFDNSVKWISTTALEERVTCRSTRGSKTIMNGVAAALMSASGSLEASQMIMMMTIGIAASVAEPRETTVGRKNRVSIAVLGAIGETMSG